MGTALYYPYIDITDGAWLRTAVLFWDTIRTIAPTGVQRPYQEADTRALEQEGILEPLRCDLQGDILHELGNTVLTFIQRTKLPVEYKRNNGRPALLHARKLGEELREELEFARLHPEKMSKEMREFFSDAASDDADFLLVDGRFANFYMTVLAATLAKSMDASPLSSDVDAHEITLATFVHEVVPSEPTDAHGALVSIVMQSLNVDPNAPIKELIRFRRARETQLAELSHEFRALADAITNSETPKETISQAQRVYKKQVLPSMARLKEELQDNGIGSAWGGFKQTALLSIGTGSVAGLATGWSAEAILGAGAFITIGDVIVQSLLARRKVRRASPYTYLLDVHSKLHVPRHLVS